jgi:phosphate transport system permease protein
MTTIEQQFSPRVARRHRAGTIFKALALGAIILGIITLLALFYDILHDGAGRLSGNFLTSFPSSKAEKAGILSALVGSIYVVLLMAIFAFPIGIGAAIYLEEYAEKSWLTDLIQINISNLAGVPSIIYGLLGLGLFARGFLSGLTGGRSILSAALTLGLLILPVVIISSREAIRAVPNEIRLAALGLGATRWQMVRGHVLPYAMPGVLITLGAATYVAFLPESLHDQFTVLPIQIFSWVGRPQPAFHANAAAGIIVLLVILISMNGFAIYLRNRFEKRLYR